MRSKRLDLSEILRVGLSPSDGVHAGLKVLKNLKSDGTCLRACPVESTYLRGLCKPFIMNTDDYYITAAGIYSIASGTPLKAYTFVGFVKIINLIEVIWLQDDVKTFVVDRTGIYDVNPSGNTIPLCNSIVHMNGQILYGGVKDGFQQLGQGFIGWSEIAFDRFTLSKENTSGFSNPNIGIIYNILPLQDSAIVLGSAGAAQMFYAGHIFGFRDLDIPRIKSVNLCASSTNMAVYVAQDSSIVVVDKNGSYQSLGFSWIGESVIDVKYLNGRNLFAFTTSDNTYLLDGKTMFSYGYRIWGEHATKLVADTTFEQLSYSFKTFETDLGKAGLKTVQEVYVQDNLRLPKERFIEIESSGTTNSQGQKLLNSLSATKYPITGDTFEISYSSVDAPKITSLIVEAIDNDKRFGAGYTPYSGGSKS